MHALVELGKITKYFSYPKGFTLGDLQYPADIFTKWSVAEKEAIGIYEVIFDDSNKKDEKYYINTNQSFAYDASTETATASYGAATPKNTAALKTEFVTLLKNQVAGELNKTDWYVIRNTEKSIAIPSNISTHRDAIRTKQASMETAIMSAADPEALKTLYTYTTTDGVHSRPLGELPVLES